MFASFEIPGEVVGGEPEYALEHGRAWQLRAGAFLSGVEPENTRYLVRRLPEAPSFLLVGAVLQKVSGLSGVRVWGPERWKREGEDVWVATRRPHGEPLAVERPERMGWARALELWRPLAEEIRRAHGRGVVHGCISPWTVWYDREAERLSAIDAGCWIGDAQPGGAHAAWWPPEFRCAPMMRMPSPFVDVYGLARLLLYLTLPPGEAERDRPNFGGLPAFAIPALERAVKLEASERLARVDELIAATSPSLLEAYEDRIDGAQGVEITSVTAARISGREEFEHPRLGQGLKFYLNTSEEGEREQLGAFFYEGADANLFESMKWGWEGAQVNLLDAKVVTDSKQRKFVTTHAETLPVLEPTFPVSVSNVLKAERCTSRFLVDERDGGESSRALVLGNLVHGLLEDLTAPNAPDFDAAYTARVSRARLSMLAAGMGDDHLKALERDARQHYANLKRFTERDAEEEPARIVTGRSRRGSAYDAQADAQGWSGRLIEAKRYSPLYGLEGRIDLATEDERAGVQIIELKSGSAWDGHLSQVRCYTLLWDGLARERGHEVSGYVLYSRYGRLNQVPMDDATRARRILRARNELVALHRSYVDSSYAYEPPHYMQEPRNCKAPTCKFRRDRCEEQTAVLGLDPGEAAREAALGGTWAGVDPELVARAWAYWRHMTRLVEMERWAQNAALGEIFQRGRLGERIAALRAVTGMKIEEVDEERRRITFTGEGAQIFSQKSSVLAHRGDLHAGHILQGRVVEAGPGRVVVSTTAAQIAPTLERGGWVLESLPTRIGVRHMHRALYRFMRRREAPLMEALLAPERAGAGALFERAAQPVVPEIKKVDVPVRASRSLAPSLNDAQREAVDLALSAPRAALIQGPPGTGKTTVIAQIVREMVTRGQRVLVSAMTNTAVDTILSKVVDAGVRGFMRVGHQRRSPELSAVLEAAGADPGLFFTETLAERTESLTELGLMLRTCPLYGCTAHAAVDASVFEYLARELPEDEPIFDVVIVDEASQLTEPLTLAAIHRGARFVLVGDHKQLGPIVQSEQALSAFFEAPEPEAPGGQDQDEWEEDWSPGARWELRDERLKRAHFEIDQGLRQAHVAGLDRSLFERLVKVAPRVMLRRQYRMHADVMAAPNALFYGGALEADASVSDARLAYSPGFVEAQDAVVGAILSADAPLVFVDVEGVDVGRANHEEVAALTRTVHALTDPEAFLTGGEHGPRPRVGVISPFRAQVQLLRDTMRRELGDRARRVDVDTVERYQGGERDIILVSTVKTHKPGEFLADPRRLNVTWTRARKKLVVFGRRECLVQNPLLRALVEHERCVTVAWRRGEGT
jgi:DNA replication ATP-dependent helicase Dna2